jgi:hypothetical protein
MATPERDRFRITPWPGVVVEIPPVTSFAFEMRGDFLVADESTFDDVPLSSELAIRDLLQVDCNDRESVVAFVREHGSIGRTSRESDLIILRPEPAGHWRHVAAHLQQAQLLSRHTLAYLSDSYVAPVWAPLGLNYDEAEAWAEFQAALNSGLRWYHARIEAELPGRSWGSPSGLQPIGLYSALCLQLLNMLTEGLPPHECANENCRHAFIRQQGRAEAGQYRTAGVEYCSMKCARAQASRNHRRRKAAKR